MKQVLENPVKNQENKKNNFNLLVVISGFMVACYLTANIMAVKQISVFNITLFDAGTITFPFAYMLGDVLTEVWGFKTAKKVIYLVFSCNIFLTLATMIGVYLPYPDTNAEIANAYEIVFGYVPRIVAASLIAFLVGELSNAWFMVKIRNITNGKFLWMRTIGSSVIGYIVDTVLFVLIAFVGVVPTKDLLTMIGFQYVAKLLVEAVSGTPLAYALIAYIKKSENSKI